MDIVLGTVTQVSPLRVRLDGTTTDSSATKITVFVATLNMRVAVTQRGSSLYVVGPLGG